MMKPELKVGDRVRVIRNRLGGARPSPGKGLLKPDDNIVVKEIGCDRTFYYMIDPVCMNTMYVDDVEQMTLEEFERELKTVVAKEVIFIKRALKALATGIIVPAVGMILTSDTFRRSEMNSQLIEFLTHPMIQSTNVLAYSSVVGLIVTALGFKTTKYVASGFAAAANRRRQRNWEMEDRKETKATLAARKAKEEQDARREVELAEKRAVEDNIMRIVAAMSNTSTRGLAQSAATTLGPGQYARFIKAGTNGAQYFDEKTKVMRLAQPGDTILIDRVSVEGNYAYKTKNGNEYYAHKDDVVAV